MDHNGSSNPESKAKYPVIGIDASLDGEAIKKRKEEEKGKNLHNKFAETLQKLEGTAQLQSVTELASNTRTKTEGMYARFLVRLDYSDIVMRALIEVGFQNVKLSDAAVTFDETNNYYLTYANSRGTWLDGALKNILAYQSQKEDRIREDQDRKDYPGDEDHDDPNFPLI